MKRLKWYQRIGVDFLKAPNGHRAHYLAADPGLGKTVISAVAIKELGITSGVIVCLDGIKIKTHWKQHLIDWCGINADDIYIVQNTKDRIPDKPWIIIGYAQVLSEHNHRQIQRRHYDLIIIDEAHKCKTPGAKRSKILFGGRNKAPLIFCADKCWLLSGTPVPNRVIELFAILLACANDVLGEYRDLIKFGKRFCNGFVDQDGIWNFKGAANVDELSKMLEDSNFMLRMDAEEVENLPGYEETVEYIEIDTEGFDESNTLLPTLRRIIGVLKAEKCVPRIRERLKETDKLVVVAYHREVIDILFDNLVDFKPLVYNGAVSAADKEKVFALFSRDKTRKLLIIQIKSGGTSLDGLQKICKDMMIIEPDWSSGDWRQLIGRLNRLGQLDKVLVLVILALGTVDETVTFSREAKDRNISRLLTPIGVKNMSDGLFERGVAALEDIANTLKTCVIHVTAVAPGAENLKEAPAKADAKAEAKPAAKGGAKGGKGGKGKALSHDDVRAVATAVIKNLTESMGKKDALAYVKETIEEIAGVKQIDDADKKILPELKEALEGLEPPESDEDEEGGDEDVDI